MKRHEPAAIILAAGKGTRMKSDLPKVMAEIGGRPLIQYVLDATFAAGIRNIVVVYGYRRTFVAQAVVDYPVMLAYQGEQLGTGHAVLQAAPILADLKGDVVVLAGDIPLIRPGTIRRLLDHHARTKATVTVLTADMPDPSGYGRMIRNAANQVVGIVEEKDATPEQKMIREINSSIYAFDWSFLLPALSEISDENAQREYYLTDTVHLAFREKLRIEAIKVDDPREVSGVNTPEQLEELAAAAREMGLVTGVPGAAA
jgi:UDP-N-acetylglucosamine diphosphorylase/glucosamine-1-phosphate N-acetyltransferase